MPTTPPSSLTSRVNKNASANDALVDLFMERAIDLIRLEAGTRNKVVDLLNQLEKELVAAIAQIDPTGVASAAYQQKRLAKLLESVKSAIRANYRDVNVLMASEIRNVADAEATWTGHAINASTQTEFVDAGITSTLLDKLVSDVMIQGAPSADWWGRQAQGLSDRFTDEMRRGIALGETNSELIDRIRGTNEARGLMDVSRDSAERLVRASVQTVANAAREQTYAENTDLISALQWHATLDTRTSIWCITRDGHQYEPTGSHAPMDDGPLWLEGPGALHWGCRSTSIPVLKSWRDLGIDEDEVPRTTRASMDGQVANKLSFEEWLKKQSQQRQDTVLGVGKADLWRDGKITFRDLLDQNGRPLTTDQLREKYAA